MPAPRNTLQPPLDKWDAFYCRLSRDDDNDGDSNSIQHQYFIALFLICLNVDSQAKIGINQAGRGRRG